MNKEFLSVKADQFYHNGKPVILRGFGLGSYLNLEHFMIGLPGTDSQIREAFTSAYGAENADLFWNTYYQCFVNEYDIRFLKSLGVNALRVPLNYRLFEDDAKPGVYKTEIFREIDRLLRLCSSYEIFVILDMHTSPGGQNPDWHSDNSTGNALFWQYPEFQERLIKLWEFIAERYKDHSWIGGYDLLNEPCNFNLLGQQLQNFNLTLVTRVRKADPNHVLFLEGDNYAANFEEFEEPSDPNTAYSVHYYAFFNPNITESKAREQIKKTLFSKNGLARVRDVLKRPIWCGETGMPFTIDAVEKYSFLLQETIAVLEEAGISWTLWTYKDAGAMGALRPQEKSSWSAFSKKLCRDWNFIREFLGMGAEIKALEKEHKVHLDENAGRKLTFSILSERQLIYTSRYQTTLAALPFEELLKLPESFRIDQCIKRNELIDIVKKYCGDQSK